MRELISQHLESELNSVFILLESKMNENDIEEIRNLSEDDLSLCHFGIGLWIRNNILHFQSKLYALFILDDVIEKDDMSSRIIKEFQKHLIEKERM